MTASAIPEGLEPLAVWDAADRTGPFAVTPGAGPFRRSFESAAWMVGNIDRAADVHRIEFYVLDL